MDTATDKPTWADRMSEDYTRVAGKVAGKLRDMADEIDRRRVRNNIHDLKPDHSAHAADTAHTIASGIANLGLERLVTAAADADRAARSEPKGA